MSLKTQIVKLVRKIVFPDTYDEKAYMHYLQKKCNINIGSHCRIYSPNQTFIDVQRPHMLHIGDYVKITRGVTILCHDFSRGVLCQMDGLYENVGECKETFIGDNVFIGVNAIILMGAHVGNDSIVGAGAVVSGIYPDGVVIAGNPGKVICTIDEFYDKRKEKSVDAAKQYAKNWVAKYGSAPTIEEMTNAFSWLYLPRNMEVVAEYNDLFELGGVDKDKFVKNFMNSEPIYHSFEDFLQDCNLL